MMTNAIRCSNDVIINRKPSPFNAIQHWLFNKEESFYDMYSENKDIVHMGDINIDLLAYKSNFISPIYNLEKFVMKYMSLKRDLSTQEHTWN